jgi:hydrogenase expression/formation protein HypC
MCVTIPLRITGIEGCSATCEARDVRREVRLDLLDSDVAVGDYVLIHAGHALQVISEADALATWELLDEITSALAHDGFAQETAQRETAQRETAQREAAQREAAR